MTVTAHVQYNGHCYVHIKYRELHGLFLASDGGSMHTDPSTSGREISSVRTIVTVVALATTLFDHNHL